MSNRQRSHREANEDPRTPPDASPALSAKKRPSRGLPRNLRKVRFGDRNGNDCGTVELIGSKIVMSEDAAAFLATVVVVHSGGRRVTPADGKHYLHGLLASFHGTAFWAEPEE